MTRRAPTDLSPMLLKRIERSLAEVDASRARLAQVVAEAAPYLERRAANAAVTAAFADADQLLREVTRVTRQCPYRVRRQWRHRLSQLDLAKQIHLFAQADAQVLGLGSVRALDTGMLGPANGDLLHGESREPGAPAGYGLDLDAILAARAPVAATPVETVAPAATEDAVTASAA